MDGEAAVDGEGGSGDEAGAGTAQPQDWVAGDVILGILWLVTKPRTRDCPACGRTIKRGQMTCKSCGYDFAQAARFLQSDKQRPPDLA
ncbi:hypothetical protein REH65_08335 [Saccharopolyspora sp. ID03-671]|uniref:zinc ribbon domain-containing protein n=1 Tax=Saccharopolyspora sp. ID03-671 TaxID=3073066 RepID=UPI00324C2F39